MPRVQARTRIKICGVRDVQTANVAVQSGADAIGLVFVPGSRRFVTPQQAKPIIDALPAFVEPVGLFVDAPVEQIREIAIDLGLRTVQLHGQETPLQVAELAPWRVVKALAFGSLEETTSSLEPWQAVRGQLAGLLFDTPAVASDPSRPSGGSGRAIDWQLLAQYQKLNAPADGPKVILAGGLTPANVGRAISLVRPYAVDVSSGVESSRGLKDAMRIGAFCRAVRAADTKPQATGT